MSSDQTETDKPNLPPKPTEAGTSPLRLVVLLVVFGLALAGLLYDYTIARPAVQKADKLVQGCFTGETEDPNKDGTFTDDEIQLILQQKPAEVQDLPNGKVECYQWRSGLLFRTHKYYVVYTGRNLPLLFSSSIEEPTKTNLPPTTKIGAPLTEEEIDSFVPMGPSQGDGEGPGGGKKRDRSGRGREGAGDRSQDEQPEAKSESEPETEAGEADTGSNTNSSEQSEADTEAAK